MEQFQTTQAEIKLNKKKIKFYKTLTDQYENAKSKKMEAEFMDDDFQIDTKKNYFNLIKKSLEWYRLH